MFHVRSRLRTCTPAAPPPSPPDGRPAIDVRPAARAVGDLVAWAAEVARAHAPELDDHEAIDRVERYLAALLAGQRACCLPPDFVPSEVDVLIFASALIDALGIGDARALLGATYAALDARPAGGARGGGDLAQLADLVVATLARGPRVAHGLDDDAQNDNLADLPDPARAAGRVGWVRPVRHAGGRR